MFPQQSFGQTGAPSAGPYPQADGNLAQPSQGAPFITQQAPEGAADPSQQPDLGQQDGQSDPQRKKSPLRALAGFFRRKSTDPDAQAAAQTSTIQPSPERRRVFGFFRRGNAADQQQGQDQQQQPPGGALVDPNAMAAGQHIGMGQAAPGVPVVPPSKGLCSKPATADEVAGLQLTGLAPSKFSALNRPPTHRSASAPGAAAAGSKGRPLPAVDPQFLNRPPLDDMYGPYLRFGGYDPTSKIYSASVVMVIYQSRSPTAPCLTYRDTEHRRHELTLKKPILLSSYAGYNFWRWDLYLQLAPTPAVIEYWVTCSKGHLFSTRTRYYFHLPGLGQKWHWGFYSCNGFHDPADEKRMGGIQPMWRDVMYVHSRDPLHVMFGGGDQLYCDDVWQLPSLRQWTLLPDRAARYTHPFTQDMVNETFDFYFRNYTTHFGKEVFRDALASIPQVMIWDDHDIFDGWGSYPPPLQNCPVFEGVFYVARKFFLLFQCHAGLENYRPLNKGWGLTGLCGTYMMGNTTAVVVLDSRGERTREQVIQPASWAAFSYLVSRLPAGVRHVVVLATVPVVYPRVPGFEELMLKLAGTGIVSKGVAAMLEKTGLASTLYSHFGEVEILDDLLDHWSSDFHAVEKKCFVRLMQDLAKARGLRFTILSGDVHCAGVACFQTKPKISLRADHRYMVQIISSAIGNVPPPAAVIRALSASHRVEMIFTDTCEKMRRVFEQDAVLKAARNWCDVHERPLLQGPAAAAAALAGGVSGGPADGALHFQLRVEHPLYKEIRPSLYDIEVPLLELPVGTFTPSPMPVPPPLPPPLMYKFQQSLAATGLGLQSALPLPSNALATTAPTQPSAAGQPLQPQMSPGQPQQAQPALTLALAQAAPAAGQQQQQGQGFGLESEVNQVDAAAQQQRQGFGLANEIDQLDAAQQQRQQQQFLMAPRGLQQPMMGPPGGSPQGAMPGSFTQQLTPSLGAGLPSAAAVRSQSIPYSGAGQPPYGYLQGGSQGRAAAGPYPGYGPPPPYPQMGYSGLGQQLQPGSFSYSLPYSQLGGQQPYPGGAQSVGQQALPLQPYSGTGSGYMQPSMQQIGTPYPEAAGMLQTADRYPGYPPS